jgi:hypothetical protein
MIGCSLNGNKEERERERDIGQDIGQSIWDKLRCYGEHVEEQTHWEFGEYIIGNLMRTP